MAEPSWRPSRTRTPWPGWPGASSPSATRSWTGPGATGPTARPSSSTSSGCCATSWTPCAATRSASRTTCCSRPRPWNGWCKLEDIRELKRALAQEVGTLKRAVQERQATEAAQYDKLLGRVSTLEESLSRARAEAATDALTGIPNRGTFDVTVREWLARAGRGRPGLRPGDGRPRRLQEDQRHARAPGGRPRPDGGGAIAGRRRGGRTNSRRATGARSSRCCSTRRRPGAGPAQRRCCSASPRPTSTPLGGEKKFLTFTFSAGVTEFVVGRHAGDRRQARRRGALRREAQGQEARRGPRAVAAAGPDRLSPGPCHSPLRIRSTEIGRSAGAIAACAVSRD